MSTRLTWLLGLVVLIWMGLLVACGSHYKASSDGLVIVPSQGSAVLQAFSFNLSNGHTAQINTAPGIKPTPPAGSQLPIVLDPTGTYAYVASTVTCTPNLSGNPNFIKVSLTGAVQGAITAYKVNSDGTLSASGSAQFLKGNPTYPATGTNTPALPAFPACGLDDSTNPGAGNAPTALAMDSSGKFLFVGTQFEAVTYAYTDNSKNPPVVNTSTATLPGVVQVFSIGSNASLTEISGSPYAIPNTLGSTTADPLSLAVTPTTFPARNAACSGTTAPTTENLYVADAANNQIFEYSIDPSTGTLTAVSALNGAGVPTGSVPSGVAVDPCNRFVYVANHVSNDVSGYTICNAISLPNCQKADGSLVSMGAPVSAGNGPTALAVDPLGNFVYVVNQLSSSISGFKISPVTGTLTSFSTTGTGGNPVSIAIRGDDSWLFVTNNQSASISQFSITPASGALAPAAATTTDSFPWGVAVK